MWRAGTWYAPYSMYMHVYTGHLLYGGQALGTNLIVCNVYCINIHKVILEFVPLSTSPCS